MSDKTPDTDDPPSSLSDTWNTENSSHIKRPFFLPEELDIYTNKLTNEAYIFHGKIIDYTTLSHMVYNDATYTVTIFFKNGQTQDLGVTIQWLLRPYMKQANEIQIVRTDNKASVDGVILPLIQITREEGKHKGSP